MWTAPRRPKPRHFTGVAARGKLNGPRTPMPRQSTAGVQRGLVCRRVCPRYRMRVDDSAGGGRSGGFVLRNIGHL